MNGKMMSGKHALVTGASQGIGEALAISLAKDGAHVHLVARSEQSLKKVAAACTEAGAASASIYPTDLTDAKAIDALCEKLLADHEMIDILVNNAAMLLGGVGLLEADPDGWDTMVDANVKAPMRLTQRLAPAMVAAKAGTIINIGSTLSTETSTAIPAYTATKFAMRGWSLCTYESLREYNIKVSLLQPAWVATTMTHDYAASKGWTDEMQVQVEDVADAMQLVLKARPGACPTEIKIQNVTYLTPNL